MLTSKFTKLQILSLFIVCLVNCAEHEQNPYNLVPEFILKPQEEYKSSKLNQSQITITTNDPSHIDNKNVEIYNISIQQISPLKHRPKSICQVSQRQIKLSEVDFQQDFQNSTFECITTYNQLIYAVTQNLDLFQYELIRIEQQNYTLRLKSRKSLKKQFCDEQKPQTIRLMNHPSKSSGFIYLMSDCGAYYFKANISLDDQNFQLIKLTEYQKRSDVYYSRIGYGHLFVAAGTEGVDIYNWNEDGSIKFFKTLNAEDFEAKSINVQDITFQNNILSVLTSNKLYFFQILNDQYINKNKLFIPLTNAFTFGQHNNLFYIAQMDYTQATEYSLIEVYVDFNQQKFFVNRNINFPFQIEEIAVMEDVAIIITKGDNFILFHGLYYKFADNEFQRQQEHTFIQDKHILKEVTLLTPDNTQNQQYHRLLIGITDDRISMRRLDIVQPYINCTNTLSDSASRQIVYRITAHSQRCPEQNQGNFFEKCTIEQDLTVNLIKYVASTDILITENQKTALVIIIVSIFIGIICFCGFTFILCKRYKAKLTEMDKELTSLRKLKYEKLGKDDTESRSQNNNIIDNK